MPEGFIDVGYTMITKDNVAEIADRNASLENIKKWYAPKIEALFADLPAVHASADGRLEVGEPGATMYVATDIRKHYGGVKALDGVDLEIRPGEVHALLGANGAGKSTLVKILVGAEQPTDGTLTLDGEQVGFQNVDEAADRGIAIVSQELNLFPRLRRAAQPVPPARAAVGRPAGRPRRDAPAGGAGGRGGRARRAARPQGGDAAAGRAPARRDRPGAARASRRS